MGELINKIRNRNLRKRRTRAKIRGNSSRPRLTVTISNMHVSAQIIDDENEKTIASASSVGLKSSGSLTEKAVIVGESIAKNAAKKKIKAVVFDRGAKKYHGRVKALADSARKNGLEF